MIPYIMGNERETWVSGVMITHTLHGICPLDDVTDLFDRLCLPEAVDTVQCLSFQRWIPTRLNKVYAAGHGKVKAVAWSAAQIVPHGA